MRLSIAIAPQRRTAPRPSMSASRCDPSVIDAAATPAPAGRSCTPACASEIDRTAATGRHDGAACRKHRGSPGRAGCMAGVGATVPARRDDGKAIALATLPRDSGLRTSRSRDAHADGMKCAAPRFGLCGAATRADLPTWSSRGSELERSFDSGGPMLVPSAVIRSNSVTTHCFYWIWNCMVNATLSDCSVKHFR